MRNGIVVLFALMCAVTSAAAQVSVGVWLPGVSIGINMPVYPTLVLVPGYPVYYAPQLNSNYFFYDGMYWVYQGDNWYASSWYNGPWVSSPQTWCRCTSCVSRCGTTGSLRSTFALGVRMPRRAGVSTGAPHGSSVGADGTTGIAARYHPRPRCRRTSVNMQGIDIRTSNSSRCFRANTTAINRATP